MKKTSLLLAVGALLYGATNVYALPEITPNMSDEDLLQVIDQMDEIPLIEQPEEENAPYTDDSRGLDPIQPLPRNVAVDSSHIVYKPKMCPNTDSFQVNGATMVEFPVTVWTTSGMTSGTWRKVSPQFPVCVGTGWILAQNHDTWYSPWRLYTTVSITKILLQPLLRNTTNDPVAQEKVYAFDVGGKLPRALYIGPQHTQGAERGQFIVRVDSSPNVAFTATYSNPVFVTAPGVHSMLLTETPNPITIPLWTPTDFMSRIPNHDLYGTLEIDFPNTVHGSSILGLAFAFIADTDCLPVVGASVSSNQLTLFGEGLVYVNETKADGSSSLMSPAFEVMKEGVNTFDVSDLIAKLKAGSCYSLVNENSLGTNIPLEVNGVDMPNAEVCP